MLDKFRNLWNLRRALLLVWQSSPIYTVLSVILAFFQGSLPVLSLYLTKLLIDSVSAEATNPPQAQVWQETLELVIVAGLVTLLVELCNSISQYVNDAQAQVVTDHVHGLLHAKSIEVDLEYYENAQYYNSLHLAQNQAPYRPPEILYLLIYVGRSLISLVAIAVLLLSLHWIVAVGLLLTALPSLVVRLKYAKILYHKQNTWTPQERRADYYNWMLTSVDHAKEIRLFNLGELFRRRFQNLRILIRKDRLDLSRRNLIAEWFVKSCTTLLVFAVFGFIAHQTLVGAITVGSLVMYYQAFQRGQASLSDAFGSLARLYENSLFLTQLYEFLDLERVVAEPKQPKAFPASMQGGIRFESVSFHYPNSNRPLLKDVNLTIGAGETIALVGENGAGKTTIIKLLCRLYDLDGGRITVDGIDLKEFSTTDLRQQFSIVFQDYVHYNLSAAENIGLGDVTRLDDLKAIQHASQKTGATKAIARLPQGYDTILGCEYEEGEELSIGEWQKIAIARAFLRQSQILVLDEPTSALDARSEYEVFEQFRYLTQGKSAILISHRLSTVKLADRIYMLGGGKIIESGTHQELMANQGAYAELFAMQASAYQSN
jgi:ATP-binding cassette, subfamily B, bacterial